MTLELGGKCPALLTPGSVTATNVESVIGTKMVKNGQMCVSVDYCLVPRPDLQSFIDHATAFARRAAPDCCTGPDCTGIISPRHLDRLTGLLDEARDRQCKIVPLDAADALDRTTRRMPISLVIDPAPDLRLMREEIFGPILPVLIYDALDDAIAGINAGERPLGLYVFGLESAAVSFVEGIVLVATPALIRDFSPQVCRATAMGFWTIGPVLGSLMVSGFATLTLPYYGLTLPYYGTWQSQFVICGGVCMVFAVAAAVFLRELSPALRDQVMVNEHDNELNEANAGACLRDKRWTTPAPSAACCEWT